MIGAGTGACPQRAASPTRDRGRPVSPNASPMASIVRGSSPRMGFSPRMASPKGRLGYSTQLSSSTRTPTSPTIRSPPGKSTQGNQSVTAGGGKALGEPVARRDGRICLHADTNGKTQTYPNMVYDPDGELIVAQRPGTFEMATLIKTQATGLNKAAAACGLVVAVNPAAKDPSKQLRCGTFFQVSENRAITAFHVVCDGLAGREPRPRELWVSKSCSANHWASLFSYPRTKAKYFRKVKIVGGFLQERSRLAGFYGDGLTDKCCNLPPRTPIDIAILELPSDFSQDHCLFPIPKSKIRSVKKVAVVSYNQVEQRDENNRTNIYAATKDPPPFDDEPKFIHFGNKTLSPGLLVGSNEAYVNSEVSLGEGCAGGPLIPLTLAHYFWAIQVCCFYDSDPTVAGGPRSRNYNVQINFYHPAVQVLYEKFVLPTLPEAVQKEVRQSCFYSP